MKYVGAMLVLVGSFALIPFKVDYLEMFDLPMYALGGTGIVLLLRATQNIGWHLVLEGNVLYYSKFNMYSSWKRIRSQEFALSQDKITKVIVHYGHHPLRAGRMLTFSTLGLDKTAKERLAQLERALQPQGGEKSLLIAVDFDGTVVEDRYPAVGRPMPLRLRR